MCTHSLLCAAFLALAPATTIQAQQLFPGPAASPLVDDRISTLITGEFSGDTHVDAVVLANEKPVLREAIETHQTYVQADVSALDIATLAGGGAGGRDRVVAIGPGGLYLLEVLDQESTPPWSIPSSFPWSISNLRGANTNWASAVAVRTGQVDGLHGDDIVAVTPTRVLIAKSNGSGGWMSDVSFVAGASLSAVELVDWDGAPGGALELALLIDSNPTGNARIRLARHNATFIQTIASNGDRIIASVVATPADGPRWLAALSTKASTGVQELALLSAFDVAGPWSLGAAGVYDSVTGDWTGDGIDDLVLGTHASRDAWLYALELEGPQQLTLQPLCTPPNPPAPLPVGHPARAFAEQDGRLAMADVDHDLDLDLITALEGSYAGGTWSYVDASFSALETTLNARVPQWEWLPWHLPGSSWPSGLASAEMVNGVLTVPLVTPLRLVDGAQFEYSIWRTPTIESLAIAEPVLGPDTLPIGQQSDGNGLSWSTLSLPLSQEALFFPDRYTLIVRQVRRDLGGLLQEESPALELTFFSALDAREFTLDWNIETYDELLGLDGPEPEETGGTTAGPGVPPTPPKPGP